MSRRSDVFMRVSSLLLVFSFVLAASTTLAISDVGGIPEPPRIIGCASPDGDTIILGTQGTLLGDEVTIPVYVGSNTSITSWQFSFKLPEGVTYVGYQTGTWTETDADTSTIGEYFYLSYSHNQINPPMYPNTEEVFLYMTFSTACVPDHSENIYITFDPLADPEQPTTYLTEYLGCVTDPIEVKTNGTIGISPANVFFDMSEETAYIGDMVSVTITCGNEVEFKDFMHYVEFNPAVVSPVYPYHTATTRTQTGVNSYYMDGDSIAVIGSNPNGFGASVPDGLDFYTLNFQVISATDDVTGAFSFSPPFHVLAKACGQEMMDFTPQAVYYDGGSVTVPRYEATFKFGDIAFNNTANCRFKVPILLKNNFPVGKFQLNVQYSNDQNEPLVSTDMTSADPLNWPMQWAGDYDYGNASYTLVRKTGTQPIDPSADFQEIAYIAFENGSDQAGILDYVVALIDTGRAFTDPTWIETDDVRGITSYDFYDYELASGDGSITIDDPLVQLSIPGAQSSYCKFPPANCQWWAYSSIRVLSNVDADTAWFDITWNPSQFCVTFENLPTNVTASGGASSGSIQVYITDIKASPAWQWFGSVKVTNVRYTDQTGGLSVINTGAKDACTSLDVASSGSGGSFFTYKLPLTYQSCRPNVGGAKVSAIPERFELLQNHPNPFNAGTLIRFNLAEPAHTTLEIFNVLGQRVVTLMDDYTVAGPYSVRWDGRSTRGEDVATGIYLYRLRSGSMVDTKKMVLLK